MIKKIAGEVWKQIQFKGSKTLRKKYAFSSLGRASSYHDDIIKDGKLLNGSLTSGLRKILVWSSSNNSASSG